jgi:hypothetical protein
VSSERYAAASRRPSREDYSPCLIVKDGARQRLAYAYYENELGSQVAQQRCGTPDCGSHRQAARAVAEGLAPLPQFPSTALRILGICRCEVQEAHLFSARGGIKVHAHMLRHSAGFKLANEGRDTRSIQAYLGHANLQNTVR